MIALPIILAVIALIGIRFSRFHSDYMGPAQTNAIKGFFAVVIVMSHMLGYTQSQAHPTEALFREIVALIGQLMVAPFFFYSGYGVIVSYMKKKDYYSTFLKTRLLKVLIHFDLAVLLFAILNFALSISFTKYQYLMCWVGWESIGNSNWFIFDTLVFYAIAFIAMTVRENTGTGYKIFASLVTVLTLLMWAVLMITKGETSTWWFDTLLCFPAGIWYGVYKDRIDKILRKWYFFVPVLLVTGAVFAFFYARRGNTKMFFILAPVFCLLLSLITTRIKFNNKILAWLGKHSFSIYIIQRIPMILISHFGLNKNNIVYTILIVVTVFSMGWAFSMLLSLVDKLLFKKGGKKPMLPAEK